jgi:hypothetical protein
MRKTMISACVLLGFCGSAFAGPFGLSMGMSLAEVQKKGVVLDARKKIGYFATDSMPNGNPEFSSYALRISRKYGLCRIVGLGKTLETSPDGRMVKAKFAELEQSLDEKYKGKTSYDGLLKESLLTDPKDWMISLDKNERILYSHWDGKTKALPDNIGLIKIEAMFLSPQQGYVTVTYEAKNVKECQKDIDQMNELRSKGL